ncbi:alpha/beta hydrolase [Sedimentibacter sp. MB31-C6]|uniref:alpha/beta hydrolase n=1 Tax=Sedimentibacter sp. MB31-C6 TaxID=3109366 RepID=UPI002DDD3381|nr:alpha/beta hydrolase [Sedimentibacter sp. MB36-C1]WSI03294.1 alpha/beta hydrolase [Sedimentibacter sp. MB36-C1]
MAINKVVMAALKAISYRDIDVKENYKMHRNFVNITRKHYLKPFYKTRDDEVYTDNYKIPVRIFSPEEEGNYPCLLFFHGGGWVTGNIDSYNKVCTNMSKLTCHNVISVDYRLAPEYPFPAALEDCYEVAKNLLKNKGSKYKDITIIGDSAGGNLAAALSLLARDKKEFKISRQILIYPSTYNDHSGTSPFPSIHENGTDYLLTSKRISDYTQLYISNKNDLRNPYFAPLLAEDLTNQPKTLIITAEYCPLRDEGEAYGKRLREAGNYTEIYRIKDGLHGFFALPPRFPQVKLCYDIINRFLCEVK